MDDLSTNTDSPNSRNTVILDNSPNTRRSIFIYDNSREYAGGQQSILEIGLDNGSIPPLEWYEQHFFASANTTSESDEEENSVADSIGTKLYDEPTYVPASTISQPHRLNNCHPPSLCMGCKIHNTKSLPFRLQEAYRRKQNNSDTGKDEWMARASSDKPPRLGGQA